MVRFGIVGTGKITEEFVMSARASGVAVPVAVYSRTEKTGRAYAQAHGLPHAFSSLVDMVESGHVDAVYIASPNAVHAEQARICLSRGMPVLMEKPAASNAVALEAVLALAKEHRILFMEALKSTLVPAFARVQSLLPELGAIRHFFASYCQYSSRYDAHLAGEYRNAFDPALSNGSLMDIGIYCVYPAVVLFGAPQTVQARGHMLSTGVDGSGSLILGYDGMDAVLMHGKNTDSLLPAEIQGEKATLRIDHINLPDRLELQYRNGQLEQIPVERELPFMSYEIREFARILESGQLESPVNSHAVSLQTLRILDEARCQMGVRYPADNA